MKPFLSIFLIITLISGGIILSGGCKKTNTANTQLSGSWRLIQYTQGFTGRVIIVPADSMCILTLDGTNYTKTVNLHLLESGPYSITNVKSIYSGDALSPAIVFGTLDYPLPQVITHYHDTLTLSMNAFDANSFDYVKVK